MHAVPTMQRYESKYVQGYTHSSAAFPHACNKLTVPRRARAQGDLLESGSSLARDLIVSQGGQRSRVTLTPAGGLEARLAGSTRFIYISKLLLYSVCTKAEVLNLCARA